MTCLAGPGRGGPPDLSPRAGGRQAGAGSARHGQRASCLRSSWNGASCFEGGPDPRSLCLPGSGRFSPSQGSGGGDFLAAPVGFPGWSPGRCPEVRFPEVTPLPLPPALARGGSGQRPLPTSPHSGSNAHTLPVSPQTPHTHTPSKTRLQERCLAVVSPADGAGVYPQARQDSPRLQKSGSGSAPGWHPGSLGSKGESGLTQARPGSACPLGSTAGGGEPSRGSHRRPLPS